MTPSSTTPGASEIYEADREAAALRRFERDERLIREKAEASERLEAKRRGEPLAPRMVAGPHNRLCRRSGAGCLCGGGVDGQVLAVRQVRTRRVPGGGYRASRNMERSSDGAAVKVAAHGSTREQARAALADHVGSLLRSGVIRHHQ